MRKIILQDSVLPIIFLKYFLSGVGGSFENIYGRDDRGKNIIIYMIIL